MADTYPKISATAWYTLRSKAVSSPKVVFTPDGVAALLGLAHGNSASNNILGPLRKMGIIDESGALAERGKKWRADETYADACQEIIDEFFPTDLAMLTDDNGEPDSAKILGWFKAKFGTSNASGMASTYKLLASKSLTPSAPAKPKASDGAASVKKASKTAKAPKGEKVNQEKPANPKDEQAQDQKPPKDDDRRPDLHIDIQVHIGADSSPEVIDQVFASMAKHIYKK